MSCNYDNIKTELSKLTDSRLKNTVIDTVDALAAFKEFMKAVEKPMGNTQSQSTSYMQNYARRSANKLEIAFMPSMVMDSEAFSEGLSVSPEAKDMYESFMKTVTSLKDDVANKDKKYNAIKNLVHGKTKSEYYPVYTATVVGTLGWLAENYSTLNAVSSLEDFPIEIGENASAEANAELNRLVASGGMYASFAADEIGKKIASVLGVQDVSDSASQNLQDNYKRFIAGLGEMGLMLLAKQGYIKEPTSTPIGTRKNAAYKAVKAKINGDPTRYGYADLSVLHADEANSKSRDMVAGWVELTDERRKAQPDYKVMRVITDAAVLEIESREPLLEKPKEVKSVKVKNQPLATAKQDLVDAVNAYNSVEWEMNDEAIREIDYLVANDDVLLRLVKYPETDDNVSLDTKLATKGKQRSAMAIVENFKKYSKELSGKGFWFNWFVAKNDRMMISSNTINPQSDKHLARWLMNPKGVGNLLDWNTVSGILDGSNTVVDETNLHEWEYVYGLVQGLGGLKIDGLNIPSIDKSSPKDVVAAARGIVGIGYAGIKSFMKDHINGGGKFDHFGQAVLALNELGKHGSDKPIKMFIEVDGLTNGLAFKMMQFPVPGVTALMGKVGIRDINESKGSMAEVKASGEELDIYETLGKEFQGLLKNRVAQIGEEKYAALQAEFSEILMPLADINSDKVTSDMRSESKPPVMTSAYSASIKTVVKNRDTDKAIKLADRIVKNPASAAKVIQSMIDTSGVVLKTSSSILDGIAPHLLIDYSEWMSEGSLDSNKIVQSLQNKQVSGTPLVAMVKALISEVEGIDPTDGTTTYQLAVDKVTGIWNTGNDAVNAMNEYMFDMVNIVYRRKVADSVDKSNEAKLAIAKELVEIWPSLAGPTGNGIKDRTLLIGTKGEFGEGGNKIQAQLIGKDGLQLVVDALERGWKGPGAGSLPIATHSMDSIVQAIVTKRLKEKYGDGYIPFLNIFDAATSYGNSFEYTKMYNEVWYEVNAKYSIMDDFNTTWNNFHNYVEALDDNDPLKYEITNATEKWESKKLKIKHEKGVDPGTYQDVVELRTVVTRDVAEGREVLLNRDLKIGQMGGLSGTMVEINGQASKDVAARSKAEMEIMKLQTRDKKKFNEFLAAEKITVEELIEEFTKVFRGCI